MLNSFFARHEFYAINDRQVERVRDKARSNALDLMRPRLEFFT